MLKLGSALLLLLVQITSLIQCQTGSLGPYHASVDDFGQAYSVPATGTPQKLGPFMDSVTTCFDLGTAPAGTVYIAIAGANRLSPTPWSNANPAWILLSSDQGAPGGRIVSDTTWKCQTFPLYEVAGHYEQRLWPDSNNVVNKITELTNNFEN